MALSAPSTDIELMQRTSNYDSKALEALYNRYSSLLYTLIKKIVGDETAAEEVLSGIFAIIWKKANYFDFSTENVFTWLVTLARNKAVDTLKRSKENNNLEAYTDEFENKYILPHLSPSIDSLDIKTALNLKENVEIALNKLTDAQQYVIYLAFYEGLTQKEIAEKLNIPLTTVKSKIKIALSNLKENLIKGES